MKRKNTHYLTNFTMGIGLAVIIGILGASEVLADSSYRWLIQNPPQPLVQGQPLVKTIPFHVFFKGDLTKEFISLNNFRGPDESTFLLGPGLAGSFMLPRNMTESGSGQKVFVHISGISNPPKISSEQGELQVHFDLPSVQLKSFYRDYSSEGDSALPDGQIKQAEIDVFFKPAIDRRGGPTYESARVEFSGEFVPPEDCIIFVEFLMPVNICSTMEEYTKQIQTLIQEGIRNALHHPQSRQQFDQVAWAQLMGLLSRDLGGDPQRPAQFRIVNSHFQGTDYVVVFSP